MCVCVSTPVWSNNNADILAIPPLLLNLKSDWRIYTNSIDMLAWWHSSDLSPFAYNSPWANTLNRNAWHMSCHEGRKYAPRLESGRVRRPCCKPYHVKDINLMLNSTSTAPSKYCKTCKLKERDSPVYNMNFLTEGCKKMRKRGTNNFFQHFWDSLVLGMLIPVAKS